MCQSPTQTRWPTWCSKPCLSSLKCFFGVLKIKCVGPKLFDMKCTRVVSSKLCEFIWKAMLQIFYGYFPKIRNFPKISQKWAQNTTKYTKKSATKFYGSGVTPPPFPKICHNFYGHLDRLLLLGDKCGRRHLAYLIGQPLRRIRARRLFVRIVQTYNFLLCRRLDVQARVLGSVTPEEGRRNRLQLSI